MGALVSKPPIEYTSESYYTSSPHDNFDEKFVALGGEKDAAALKFRNVVSWTPEEPKAIVLICHGLHDHSIRYHKLAHALTAQRFVVYGMDHMGHGKSSGLRALVSSYYDLIEDFSAFAEYVRRKYPSLPLFIIGHGMGALVAMLSMEPISDVAALVLCSPTIYAGEESWSPCGCGCLYPLARTSAGAVFARLLAAVDPTGPAAPMPLKAFTSDKEQLEIMQKDPLFYDGDILSRSAFELLKMSAACRELVRTLTTPFLCIHGSDDRIALASGSQFLLDRSSTEDDKKSLIIMPGLRHAIFHEKQPESAECTDAVVDYLLRCFAEGYDVGV